MEKTRGAYTFRSRVRQGPSSPANGSSAADIVSVGPSAVAGPSIAATGTDPSAPAARPTVAPAAGDAEGSSSVAPAQRRYHTRVGPTPPAPSHPRPSRRALLAKRLRHQPQGSHHHLDPRPRPLHLIRVLPEPQTYLRGPSSDDLTSLTTPFREMLVAGIEIFMGRCTNLVYGSLVLFG